MTNRRQWLFLCLAALGTILPLAAFAPFVVAHGLSLGLFIQLLWQTPVSRFFTLDVLISAVTLFLFMYLEGRRLNMSHRWICVICTILVGVSLGFPLFLYLRDVRLLEIAKDLAQRR